ncbi:hypothetical protein [Capnocytophaga bilenii]
MSNNNESSTTTKNAGLPAYNSGINTDEEPPKGGGVFSKIIILLLALATGGLGYYTYSLYQDKEATELDFQKQKTQVENELKALKNSYDRVVDENKNVSSDLLEARNKIRKYIDSLQAMKVNISALARYKNQAFALAKERDFLLKKNDSLLRVNRSIRKNLDSISTQLSARSAKLDSLTQQAKKLKEVVDEGAALQIAKLVAEGVKGSKNKITEKARATDKIRVCFTVEGNKIAKKGNRFFYIKVSAPSGAVLGANEEQSKAGVSIRYSTATKFIYSNKSVDVCDFISKATKEFEKGTYKITVYDDRLAEVGTSELILK